MGTFKKETFILCWKNKVQQIGTLTQLEHTLEKL